MLEIKKFTPLSQSQIEKIIADADFEVSVIARKAAALVGEYGELIAN